MAFDDRNRTASNRSTLIIQFNYSFILHYCDFLLSSLLSKHFYQITSSNVYVRLIFLEQRLIDGQLRQIWHCRHYHPRHRLRTSVRHARRRWQKYAGNKLSVRQGIGKFVFIYGEEMFKLETVMYLEGITFIVFRNHIEHFVEIHKIRE